MLPIKVADASLKGNKLYLCANDRVVVDLDLDKEIVDLDKKIFDDKGFYYVSVLTGDYLDNHVDMNRASFDFSDSKEDEDISIDEITSHVRVEMEEFLKEYLDEYQEKFQTQFGKISEANKAALAEYVAHKRIILDLLKKGIRL